VQTLGQAIHRTCHLTGAFTLRSGQVSSEYFDKYLFESDPKLLRRVAEAMIELLPLATSSVAWRLAGFRW